MSSQNTSSQTAKFCWMRLSRFSRAHTIPFPPPNGGSSCVNVGEVFGKSQIARRNPCLRRKFWGFGNHVFGLNVLVSNYFLLILYAPQVSTKVASIQPYIIRRRIIHVFSGNFLAEQHFPLVMKLLCMPNTSQREVFFGT